MNILRYVVFPWLVLFAAACSGMEIGGKLGVYAVDTHAERSETLNRPQRMSLKCLWSDCSGDVAQGS